MHVLDIVYDTLFRAKVLVAFAEVREASHRHLTVSRPIQAEPFRCRKLRYFGSFTN